MEDEDEEIPETYYIVDPESDDEEQAEEDEEEEEEEEEENENENENERQKEEEEEEEEEETPSKTAQKKEKERQKQERIRERYEKREREREKRTERKRERRKEKEKESLGWTKEVNVVIVGGVGVGKSSLGNYLYNLGDKSFRLFESSALPSSAVERKDIQVRSFGLKYLGQHIRINLMDTPGLSEANPQLDISHMLQLFAESLKMKVIHVVIIVASLLNRFDSQTVHTIQYYESLFEPVFAYGTVFLAIPNFGQRKMDELMEDLEDEDQIVDILSERLKLWRSECEAKLNGTSIASCAFFESLTSRTTRKKEIEFFKKGRASHTVDRMSILSRNQFFYKMMHAMPVYMKGHTFPLPKLIEEKRVARLDRLECGLKELIQKIAAQYDIHSSQLSSLSLQSKDIIAKLLEASLLDDEIMELEQVVRGGHVYVDGEELVTFQGADVYPVWAEIEQAVLRSEAYNCKVTEKSREEVEGRYVISVEIAPKKINLFSSKKKGVSISGVNRKMWYCKVWAEWDGAEANKEPIAKKKERANNLRIEADTLQQFLEKNQNQLLAVSDAATIFKEKQRAIQEELLLISKGRYSMAEAHKIIHLLSHKSLSEL